MISNFMQKKTTVYVFIVNGYRMQGVITDATEDYIVLNNSTLIFKHAISTIQPV